MTVRDFLAKLQELASVKGLLDTSIESVGTGQCRMDDTPKVYHYFSINLAQAETLRVFTDYDEKLLSFEDVLNFDYKAVAYDEEKERLLLDILNSIPTETAVLCEDTINKEKYDIPPDERAVTLVRYGARTVVDVKGDKSSVRVILG